MSASAPEKGCWPVSVAIDIDQSGCARSNRISRGNSQVNANPGRHEITIVRSFLDLSRNWLHTSEMRPKPSVIACASCSPSRVGREFRAPRTRRSRPNHSSSVRTCWLTALWLTPSSVAAAEKPEWRTTASKARKAENGRLRIILVNLMSPIITFKWNSVRARV